MTWQMLGLAAVRVMMVIPIYFIARHITEYQDTDIRIYWMFGIGYIVGRIWSLIGS